MAHFVAVVTIFLFASGCGKSPPAKTSTSDSPATSGEIKLSDGNATTSVTSPTVGTERGKSTRSDNEPQAGAGKVQPTEPGRFRELKFADFQPFDARRKTDPPGESVKSAWSVLEDGTIHCAGTPRGYLQTRETFDNFTLKLEYRFVPGGGPSGKSPDESNTGVLCYVNGPDRLWPRSIEVQGKQSEVGMLRPNGGAKPVEFSDDEMLRKKAVRPIGEWNQLEIRSREGSLTSMLNGVLLCVGKPGELKSGRIGFQSEDFSLQLRKILISVP